MDAETKEYPNQFQMRNKVNDVILFFLILLLGDSLSQNTPSFVVELSHNGNWSAGSPETVKLFLPSNSSKKTIVRSMSLVDKDGKQLYPICRNVFAKDGDRSVPCPSQLSGSSSCTSVTCGLAVPPLNSSNGLAIRASWEECRDIWLIGPLSCSNAGSGVSSGNSVTIQNGNAPPLLPGAVPFPPNDNNIPGNSNNNGNTADSNNPNIPSGSDPNSTPTVTTSAENASNSSDEEHLRLGYMIAIIVAVFVGLLIISGILFFIARRNKKRARESVLLSLHPNNADFGPSLPPVNKDKAEALAAKRQSASSGNWFRRSMPPSTSHALTDYGISQPMYARANSSSVGAGIQPVYYSYHQYPASSQGHVNYYYSHGYTQDEYSSYYNHYPQQHMYHQSNEQIPGFSSMVVTSIPEPHVAPPQSPRISQDQLQGGAMTQETQETARVSQPENITNSNSLEEETTTQKEATSQSLPRTLLDKKSVTFDDQPTQITAEESPTLSNVPAIITKPRSSWSLPRRQKPNFDTSVEIPRLFDNSASKKKPVGERSMPDSIKTVTSSSLGDGRNPESAVKPQLQHIRDAVSDAIVPSKAAILEAQEVQSKRDSLAKAPGATPLDLRAPRPLPIAPLSAPSPSGSVSVQVMDMPPLPHMADSDDEYGSNFPENPLKPSFIIERKPVPQITETKRTDVSTGRPPLPPSSMTIPKKSEQTISNLSQKPNSVFASIKLPLPPTLVTNPDHPPLGTAVAADIAVARESIDV